jgi:hypothetical protein
VTISPLDLYERAGLVPKSRFDTGQSNGRSSGAFFGENARQDYRESELDLVRRMTTGPAMADQQALRFRRQGRESQACGLYTVALEILTSFFSKPII